MQIGPRIRVGGTLGKIGQKAKIGVGKLAQPVGKVVGVFNPALGTAISTAGDILDTTDGKFNFKKAAKNAVIQYGASKLANVGGKKILGALKRGGDTASMAGDIGLPGGDIASAAEPGRFRSIIGTAGKFLGGSDGFGMDDVLKYGKAAGDAFGAYEDRERFGRMEDIANREYAAGAPMRDAGRQMLMDQSRPDLSGVFTEQPQRYRKITVGSRV